MFNHGTEAKRCMGNRLDLTALVTGGVTPVLTESNIPGLTVARTATGKYRFTFLDLPGNAALAKVQVTIGDTAFVDATYTVDTSALLASKILDVYTGVAGVAANLSATAQIHLWLEFKDTGVTRG